MVWLLKGSRYRKGIAPIKGNIINASSSSALEDFMLRSLRSHNAFSRKPTPKKAMQVMKSGIRASVSL